MEDTTDPNLLYDLQRELDAFMIYTQEEINDVCKLEFSTKKKTVKTQEKLNAILDREVQRYSKETNKEKNMNLKEQRANL